jgi:RNA polymerase sigma factor (sigma-70 family)
MLAVEHTVSQITDSLRLKTERRVADRLGWPPSPAVSLRFGIGLVFWTFYGEAQVPQLLGPRSLTVRMSPSACERIRLCFLTGQRLQLIHRQHLGTQMRDAGREVSLYRGAMPQAASVSLAAQLLGRFTSVTQAVQRAEMRLILQEAINALDFIDREILALRHFEELSNDEAAQVLGIKPSAASNRHVCALGR